MEHLGHSEITNHRASCLSLNKDRTKRSSLSPKILVWKFSADGDRIGVEGRYLPEIVCNCPQGNFCCHVQWYRSLEVSEIAWVFLTAIYCITWKKCTIICNKSFKNIQVPLSYDEWYHCNFDAFTGSFMLFGVLHSLGHNLVNHLSMCLTFKDIIMFIFREVLTFALNSKMSYRCGKLAIDLCFSSHR